MMRCRLIALIALFLSASLAAQEAVPPAAPPVEESSADRFDYLFAHSVPSSLEEALRAVELFEASTAALLILTPKGDVQLAPDFGIHASRPVLVTGQRCDASQAPCVKVVVQDSDVFMATSPDATGMSAGDAHLARREHRGSRWCVLAVSRYVPLEDPRFDLNLLRDDPVDVLLVGASSLLKDSPDAKSPYANGTFVFGPMPADAGPLRLFEVSDSGIRTHVPKETAPAE